MKTNRKAAVAVIAIAILSAGSAIAAEKWVTGDFHQHTYLTDGSWPMNDLDASGTPVTSALSVLPNGYKQGVIPTGFRFGLDFQANSEHGGRFARDGFGTNWTTYTPNPILGDDAGTSAANMWRWQSLIRTSDIMGYSGAPYLGAFAWIEQLRLNYPEKLVMTGMEWNVPGHEHCSTGIAAANALPIAEFEYRFDNSDSDGTSTTTTADIMGWTGKKQNSAYTVQYDVLGLNATHEKAIDAVKWMQQNYPAIGWIVPAHVERRGCGGIGNQGYTIAAFRDMNDNGPDVAFGFEGIPGHEKSSNRGELGASACGGGSYGGAGTYVATVSGLWDNLLADGRKFWNFANSDYHNNSGADFWPGEYLKTYVKAKDANNDGVYTQEDVVNGLRSGNAYSVHGDIINDLDFRALWKTPYGIKAGATMGETLQIKKGNKATILVRFKTPVSNNCQAGVNSSAGYICQTPSVHHIQLIQGTVNATKASKFNTDGTPNPAFNATDSCIAKVVATFDKDGGVSLPATPACGSTITSTKWTTDAQGYTTMTFTVPNVQSDMFFRIRGANLGYNVSKMSGGSVVYGTDAAGNPLKNTPGTNSADMAWDDLWFYSNPIFVKACTNCP